MANEAKGRGKVLKTALLVLALFALPYIWLVAFRPNFAFEKRVRISKPIPLTEDPNIKVIEYGWLKGSQLSYSDGKNGSGFEALGLGYIGYQDGDMIKYRWSVHVRTDTTWDSLDNNNKPINARMSITLH